jgi:hypothetical protein
LRHRDVRGFIAAEYDRRSCVDITGDDAEVRFEVLEQHAGLTGSRIDVAFEESLIDDRLDGRRLHQAKVAAERSQALAPSQVEPQPLP